MPRTPTAPQIVPPPATRSFRLPRLLTPHLLTLALGVTLSLAPNVSATPALPAGTRGGVTQSGLQETSGIVQIVDDNALKVVFEDSAAVRRNLKLTQAGKKASEKTEYAAQILPVQLSEAAARRLKTAWQTFQDRSRWTLSTSINGGQLDIPPLLPIPIPLYNSFSTECLIPVGELEAGLARGIANAPLFSAKYPETPKATVSNDGTGVRSGYRPPNGLNYKSYDDEVNLPGFLGAGPFQFPRLEYGQFCPDHNQETTDTLLGILPHAVYSPGVMFCGPFGCGTTPNFPKPLAVNWAEVKRRQQEACGTIRGYYKDYYREVGAALATMPGGLSWSDRQDHKVGLYNVPVAGLVPGTLGALDVARKTGDPRIISYYAPTGNGVIGGGSSATYEAGILPLEEVKRFMPVMTLPEQSRYGMANIFQAWLEPEAVIDSKIQMYHFNSVCIGLGCTVTPGHTEFAYDTVVTPVGCTFPGTRLGTTTFLGERAHYRWVTVPEGYQVPDVSGTPVRGMLW